MLIIGVLALGSVEASIMQEYFLPAFFILLAMLFLLMVLVVQRKQAKVDAVRSKYYRKHLMQASAKAVQHKTPHGFEVLYERRAGDDRRIGLDRRQHIRVGADRRQSPGRRKEDLVWADKTAAKPN